MDFHGQNSKMSNTNFVKAFAEIYVVTYRSRDRVSVLIRLDNDPTRQKVNRHSTPRSTSFHSRDSVRDTHNMSLPPRCSVENRGH